MADWRRVCRQCGRKPKRGRAWCRRCLVRRRVFDCTDIDHITQEEFRALCERDPSPVGFVTYGGGAG
jgi:hypothetical protein